MNVPISMHSNQSWVCSVFLFLAFFISSSSSDPRISQSGLYCGKSKTKSAVLISAFVKEMETLSELITDNSFATYNLPNSSFPIYALAQCHQDLSQTDCLLCYAASRTKLPRCLPSLSGRVYFDGCFLRYDIYDFYQESVSSVFDSVQCGNENFDDRDGKYMEFFTGVGHAVRNVTVKAVENSGFGVVEVEGIYALAQCWDSVGREGCRICLAKAAKAVRGCVPKREGRGMNAGCYLRYSTDKFFDREDTKDGHGFFGFGVAIAMSLAIFAFIMLLLFAVYASYVRFSKAKEELNNLGEVSDSFKKSGLNFKYETLEKATDYFNPSKKLGQGGAGSVFVGKLPNGQTVAVKRLIFNTKQWVDEFFNEVNLIRGIQHKNLVKLLGCSIEGPESLLVYEYVPNKSLDHFIFDKTKSRTLNWKQRFDIIVGTAEGLAFLHGGSEDRLIHRDIKCSNVLLDQDFAPKIADFGLVRCVAADKSHHSTGIAGTIGYMAPEYLIRGQLTEKADVYSFGVVVLEIVGGKRCNAAFENCGSLLQTVWPTSDGKVSSLIPSLVVWQLYRSNRLVEAVDPCLNDDFPAQEASTVLQIGLLCTQAEAALRPSMEQVIQFLTSDGCDIPTPNQPPYMNNSLHPEPDGSKWPYSTTSSNLVYAAPIKVEAISHTSSQSSSVLSSDGPSTSQDRN